MADSEMPTSSASADTLCSPCIRAVSMRTRLASLSAPNRSARWPAERASRGRGDFGMMLSIIEQMFRYSVTIVGGAGPRVKPRKPALCPYAAPIRPWRSLGCGLLPAVVRAALPYRDSSLEILLLQLLARPDQLASGQIGRASCRERV